MHFSRLGRTALALLAGAVATPPLAAQRNHADVNPTPEVRKLELNGVSKAVDVGELRANIYTTATTCKSFLLAPICAFSRFQAFEERHYLNRQELARDVLRIKVFYYKRGYRETQVDTAVSVLNEKQVAVRFDIVEGPPTLITDLSVAYDSTLLRPRSVRRATIVHPGDPLDLLALDTMRVGFQNALWELGYADALVDTSSVVDAAARTARVQFRLVPNHLTTVGDITITGTDKVAPSTVLNSLSFRRGDLFRRSALLESQRNLYESNLFRLATIEVPPTFDSVKAVTLVLREAPLHEARLSGGFNTVDFVQTEGRYTAYNLLGGARRLQLSATVGNLFARSLNGRGIFHQQITDPTITGDTSSFLQPTWQTSISLLQPAFLQRPRNSLSITAFAQRRSVPSVVIDRGYGGNLTFTHSLAPRAPLSLTYQFEVTRVEANDPYFCINVGVCDTTTIAALRGHQRLSPLMLQVQVDRSDQPLNPMRGYQARAQLQYASQTTVSDYAYSRAVAEGALYSRFGGRKTVLATHLRVGFVRAQVGLTGDAVLHPRTRFYAGGAQSVRGFGENQLGPRVLTLPHEYLINATTTSGAPCDAYSDAIRFCDPNHIADSLLVNGQRVVVGDEKFTPRPLGGTSLLEASVEYRFPLPLLSSLQGAVFVDGAAVGSGAVDALGNLSSLGNLVHGTAAVTPGFGIRYVSPVGPIRVDLGVNPSRTEELAVVTEIIKNGKRQLVALDTPRRFSPTGSSTGLRAVLNRLTLHLSIGQAY
jgi:outer membrane protein assembly factor BamA